MQFVANFFQKHREKAILGGLILLSLTLLLLPESVQFRFARSTLNTLLLPVSRGADFVDRYFILDEENVRLKRLVATLWFERDRLLQYRDERERLRRLAAFREEQFYKLVAAEVVGRNLDRFQTILVIDKGSENGLKERMPVLSYQGYVGRLYRVFPYSSWVQLICSKNHAVSGIDRRSRVVGILEWRERNTFDLTNVSAVEDVQVGDTLMTSGFGGVVPKGFPVAVVTKVATARDGLRLKVEARSDVKFRSLEEVFVLTDEVPWDRAIFYESRDSALVQTILEGE
ncbi:MAG: rod shape-determining protein MreC [Candidatus Latescibacterota bacterium]|jgi:rod shape-determining protein MreC